MGGEMNKKRKVQGKPQGYCCHIPPPPPSQEENQSWLYIFLSSQLSNILWKEFLLFLKICSDREFISCFEDILCISQPSQSGLFFTLGSNLYLCCSKLLISCEAMPSLCADGDHNPPIIFFHISDRIDWTLLHFCISLLKDWDSGQT